MHTECRHKILIPEILSDILSSDWKKKKILFSVTVFTWIKHLFWRGGEYIQPSHPSTRREKELPPYTLSINNALCLTGSWSDWSPPLPSTGLSPCQLSPPLSPVPQFLTIPANFPLKWHEARWGWWTLGHTVCSALRMQWRSCRLERYVTVCPPSGIPEFHIRLSVQKIFPTVALKCNVHPFTQNKLGKKKKSNGIYQQNGAFIA